MSERAEQLLQTGNEASARVRNLWITFLLFGTYLAIAIGGTTHRQMLLEEPIILPILNAGLPLVQFYQIAPVLFLIFHFYLLVQLYLLAQKLHGLDGLIEDDIRLKSERALLRKRADNFLITQMLVGKTGGVLPRMFIHAAAWLTMIFAPVILLLAFQVQFLPYHDVFTTWMQRATLTADVLIVWLLWPVVIHPGGRLGGAFTAVFVERPLMFAAMRYEWQQKLRKNLRDDDRAGALRSTWESIRQGGKPLAKFLLDIVAAFALMAASFAVIGFSVLVATIPAEEVERWLLDHPLSEKWQGERIYEEWWVPSPRFAVMDDQAMARCLDRPMKLDAKDDAQWDKAEGWGWDWWWPGAVHRQAGQAGNCIPGAVGFGHLVLDIPNLSVRLEGTRSGIGFDINDETASNFDLSVSAYGPWFSKRARARQVPVATEPNFVWWPTAILFEGEADQASSKVTSLFSRNLVLVDDIDLVTLNDDELAKVDRTLVLRGRDLRYARFDRADLRKADLLQAKLTGASLQKALLVEANLESADLQGVDLRWAEMAGAYLVRADFGGANLRETKLQGADMRYARLNGAEMMHTNLMAADLRRADIVDAKLGNPNWDGTDLRGVRDPQRLLRQVSNGRPTSAWTRRMEQDFGEELGRLGCELDPAPYIARGLFRRVSSESDSDRRRYYHTVVSLKLLADGCLGSKELTAEEKAKLRIISKRVP